MGRIVIWIVMISFYVSITIVCIYAFLGVNKENQLKSDITWLGPIAYGQKTEGGYAGMGSTIGTIDGHYEIGLRGDGVITWREAGEKK